MSKASPAASSSVLPSTVNEPGSDVEQQRVTAAREQAEEGRLDGIGLEEERGDVPVQVVDRHKRQAARPGERLRGGEAHEQRADEAGATRHGEALDVRDRRARLLQRLGHDRDDQLRVAPRRDLRDDAAVAGVGSACEATTFERMRPSGVIAGHDRLMDVSRARIRPGDRPGSGSR